MPLECKEVIILIYASSWISIERYLRKLPNNNNLKFDTDLFTHITAMLCFRVNGDIESEEG